MDTLANAAREMIEATLGRIRARRGRDDGDEDLASALREQQAIEAEIEQLETLLAAARELSRMKHPSVEQLLRARGFGFEADRVAELVMAIEAIDSTVPE